MVELINNKTMERLFGGHNLRFIGLRKAYYKLTSPGNSIGIKFTLTRTHYSVIFLSGVLAAQSLFMQIATTRRRAETFEKNLPLIEFRYAEEHKKALGDDAKINKFGYPDMGNGLYGDALPYKDWVRMNNTQRAHQLCYENLPIALSSAFISGLSFPGLTAGFLFFYGWSRWLTICGLLGDGGFTYAEGWDQTCIGLLFFFQILAGCSALRLMGAGKVLTRMIPKRFKK